jgi:hypothetical protein
MDFWQKLKWGLSIVVVLIVLIGAFTASSDTPDTPEAAPVPSTSSSKFNF